MEEGFRSGWMGHATKATGRTTKPTEGADLFTLMVTFMKETGRMTRLMGKVSTRTRMDRDTKASGRKTSSMGME